MEFITGWTLAVEAANRVDAVAVHAEVRDHGALIDVCNSGRVYQAA